MANVNIQGAIPLRGEGFVCKTEGNYKPGQYRELVNAELTDEGNIITRRPIKATAGSFTRPNPFPFVGFIDDYVILAAATGQRAVGVDSTTVLWAPTNLPVPSGGYHKIVGAFKYNKVNYWLTLEYNPTGTVYNLCAYYTTTDLLTATFASLTRKVLVTTNSLLILRNYFIFKDRLWLISDDKIWFSKSTDPLTWTVPDGGFFMLPDTKVKYAFSLNDTVYILADNSTHVFTYSVDPNSDGYMRPISNNIGGEWGCAHQSRPYLVNRTGIYSISNMNLEKVHDTEWDTGENIFESKLLSFEEYLVVIRRLPIDYAGNPSTTAAYWNQQGKVFTPNLSDNTLNYNVFFINTDNGSTHAVDFTDSNDTAEKGYIIDAMVNLNRDFDGDYRLFFLTSKSLGGLSYTGSTYYMNPERGSHSGDTARKSDNSPVGYKPRIKIEIDSYVPDGNEYNIKKFRTLLAMAKFPESDFGISIGWDNNDFLESVPLSNSSGGRPHYPARVALNQRARAISLRLETLNPLDVLLGNYSHLEISDLRVLWTYTKRLPDKRTDPL